MLSTAPACGLDTPGQTTSVSQTTTVTGTVPPEETPVPADEVATAAEWKAWLNKQRTTGNGAIADYANPEQMNRFTWYDAHHWQLPYPGDPRIFLPNQVPGAALPGPDAE